MAINLFNNGEEEANFYDLLAARKLKEKKAERASYEAEIKTAIEKCGEILAENGIEYNYFAELEALEEQIKKESEINAS